MWLIFETTKSESTIHFPQTHIANKLCTIAIFSTRVAYCQAKRGSTPGRHQSRENNFLKCRCQYVFASVGNKYLK